MAGMPSLAVRGAFVALVVVVAGAIMVSGLVSSSSTGKGNPTTLTLTSGENFEGSFLYVTALVRPNVTQPTGNATFSFLVSSGTVGTFGFAIATQGASPPPQLPVATALGLPSYVSVSFDGSNTRSGVQNLTVVFTISTTNAPMGSMSLEFVVLQQQNPTVTAETTFPIVLTIK